MVESKEPSFLRKLKKEYEDSDRSRHERPLARPRKRQAENEEEEEPVFLDEESLKPLSRDECHLSLEPNREKQIAKQNLLSSPELTHYSAGVASENAACNTMSTKKQQVYIGGSSKKRLVKVVGGSFDTADQVDNEDSSVDVKKGGPNKKRNKVVLSFDQDADISKRSAK